MSMESVESKRVSRKKKGEVIVKKETEIIQGDHTGEFRDKPVRENVLNDVLKLKNQGKTKDEIHAFGCGKYSFRDDNPWEDRYFEYIEENGL